MDENPSIEGAATASREAIERRFRVEEWNIATLVIATAIAQFGFL